MRASVPKLIFGLAAAAACCAQAAPQRNASDPIAIVAGQPIYEQEVVRSLGPQLLQLRNQEYQLKSKALDDLIRQKLIEAEANKQGISAQELLEQEVDSKLVDPTDAEVEAFFLGQNRANERFDQVKEQFRATLKRARLYRQRQAYADSLRSKMEVAILLRPPSSDVTYDPSRVRGDSKAPVTIVEFSDFQCPYCKQAATTMNDLLSKYNGRVKLAFRDFPLREIHPQAQIAAEAARCACDQGKFWEFHDALFANQSKLDEAALIAQARVLGLNESSFQSCLTSGKFKAKIEADLQEGSRVGVSGTPGFFINGVFLNGAQPQAEFERIIDNALAILGNPNSTR